MKFETLASTYGESLSPEPCLCTVTCRRIDDPWAGGFGDEDVSGRIDGQIVGTPELTGTGPWAAEFVHLHQVRAPEYQDHV